MHFPPLPCLRRVLIAATLALLLPVSTVAQSVEHKVRIVDGDTVITTRGERIRLVGLDAPELRRARCPRERRLAEQARAELRRLAAGGLHLQRRGRDRDRSTLAVAHTPDGRDVAAVLIGKGLARPYYGGVRRAGWCAAHR